MNKKQTTLIMMAKYPALGRVKTRLAKGVGFPEATRIYRQLLNQTLREVINHKKWHTVIAITPGNSRLPHIKLKHTNQGQGNLGQRMAKVVREIKTGKVIVIGTDCPDLSASHIEAVAKQLDKDEAVIGPSADGGYWLIGFKTANKAEGVFKNVRWSSSTTLKDTLNNMRHLRVGTTVLLTDMDTEEDYRAYIIKKNERKNQ